MYPPTTGACTTFGRPWADGSVHRGPQMPNLAKHLSKASGYLLSSNAMKPQNSPLEQSDLGIVQWKCPAEPRQLSQKFTMSNPPPHSCAATAMIARQVDLCLLSLSLQVWPCHDSGDSLASVQLSGRFEIGPPKGGFFR